jgi:hypothetical protein
MNKIKLLNLVLLIQLLCLFLFSCSNQEDKDIANNNREDFSSQQEQVILARVDNQPITQLDLERMLKKSKISNPELAESVKAKFLEALISNRAIIRMHEKNLSKEDLYLLEQELKFHRDDLILQHFIEQNSKPEIISEEMLRKHYDDFKENYGAVRIRRYEMIHSKRKLKPEEIDGLSNELKDSETKKDWKKWVSQIKKQGYPVGYQKTTANPELLHPHLLIMIRQLNKNEVSGVRFISGVLYLVRLLDDSLSPPKPFHLVRDKVQKDLAMIKIRNALKKAKEIAMKEVKIERLAPLEK